MAAATLTAKAVMDASGFLSPTQQMTRALRGLQQWSGLAGISTGGLTAAFATGGAAGIGFAAAATTLRAGLAGVATAANLAKDALSWGAQLSAEQEQAQVAFTTMLHSGEKATAMLKDLEKFATATPFDFPQVRNAAKSLLGMGISASSVQPALKTLGEISSGVGVPLEQLAMVFGQVKTAGRLMTQDMNQFTSAGVALPKALAKELGIAETSVRKFVETGKVDFRTFQNALVRLAETDFAGGMEKQSRTFLGAMSTLQDSAGGLFKDIAGGLGAEFNVTEWVNDLAGFIGYVREEWGPDLVNAFKETAKQLNDALGPTRETLIALFRGLQQWNYGRHQMFKGTVSEDTLGAGGMEWGNVFGKAAGALESSSSISSFLKEHSVTNKAGEGLKRTPSNLVDLLGSFMAPSSGADGFSRKEMQKREALGKKDAKGFLANLGLRGAQGMGFLGALGNVAQDVGFAGGRVMSRFGKRSDIQETQKTGALQVGSSEAFSKIIDAMTGKDRNSTAKQSLEVLKSLEKAAMSQVDKLGELIKAAGGSVVNAFRG